MLHTSRDQIREQNDFRILRKPTCEKFPEIDEHVTWIDFADKLIEKFLGLTVNPRDYALLDVTMKIMIGFKKLKNIVIDNHVSTRQTSYKYSKHSFTHYILSHVENPRNIQWRNPSLGKKFVLPEIPKHDVRETN